AGPSFMHRSGLRRLAGIHRRHPWASVVLALHERPRADLAEIIQVGADDLVPLHADDAEFHHSLTRAARITRARLGAATAGPVAGGAPARGRIVTVSSASGGCGKTFLATNAAEYLARTTGQPVVLVDLDLQFGEVSTALRLRADVTITDVLAAEAEGHDLDEILDSYLLDHPDGFKVLAAPRRPAEADSVTPGDVTRILDVLRARRAWVVIDTHEGLSDLFGAVLEATDHLFAVATPDRPSIVNLGRYLKVLARHGLEAGNISLVLNKADDGSGLDGLDLAAELGRRFDALVPYDRDVPRSINTGVPLIVGKPRSPLCEALTAALSTVLPRERSAPEVTGDSVPADAPEIDLSDGPAGTAEVPTPPVAPATTLAPADAAVTDAAGGADVPLRVRHDRPVVRSARCGGRCRRTGVAIGGPCRGRGPPPARSPCRPAPPSRRAEVASSPMRSPPAVFPSRPVWALRTRH
ncbi:MAG TPA: hypothetical protein VHL53_09495, partial [Acidimicrobiia bacterium]|nr:hypothetical protein [Acidimicrobiia bacterium]